MRHRIESGLRGAVAAATLAAGALVAQQVAGRATRDALFLSTFRIDSLPLAMIASALASAASVLAFSAALSRRAPARVLPPVVAVGTVLLVGEWALSLVAPRAAALAVYLHMAVFGATLLSGFWSLVNERFDPYTAKKAMGPIGLGAAFGGVIGGAVAWAASGLLPVFAMLLVMAALSVVGLLAIDRLLATAAASPAAPSPPDTGPGPLGALRLLGQAPYLRDLAMVVALGAATETIVDYVLNAQAAATFASGQPLMSFFALLNTGIGLVGLAAQTMLTRTALTALGLAGTVALRPALVGAAAFAGAVDPRLWAAILARGVHGVLSNSLFRSAYELLYTPLPERQKRPAKSIVDVGFDRLGTVAGGALALAAAWALGPGGGRVLFAAAAATALATLVVSRRLHRGYVAALEESLRSGLIRLDSGDVLDSTTQATLAFTGLGMDRRALLQEVASFRAGSAAASADPVVQAVAGLRSGDVEDVRWALRRLPDLPAAVTGHAVPLLARTDLYLEVLAALRLAAPRATGQIVDALLDPSLPPEARRRIPRVLRGCPADRAVAGLVQALEDGDFEVRRQSALALERLVEHDPALRPSREVAFGTAIRELERGPVAWSAEAGEPPSPGDASPGPEAPALSTQERGLAHVFTLLALALDREPTRIAHRALRGGDPALRGTALEYLENVLPEAVRAALWPHLGVGGRRPRSARPAHEVERELLRRKP